MLARVISQTTHVSLLARLADGKDPAAWSEFSGRYGELIRGFCRRQGLQDADCQDVTQEVLVSLTKAMPGFTYDPAKGKFRSYLKTAVVRAIARRTCQKSGVTGLGDIESLAPSAGGSDESAWEAEWRQYHLRLAMKTIEAEFNEIDRAAFERYALRGMDAERTASLLGISVDQVYQVKSRITRRLAQLIDQQVAEEG